MVAFRVVSGRREGLEAQIRYSWCVHTYAEDLMIYLVGGDGDVAQNTYWEKDRFGVIVHLNFKIIRQLHFASTLSLTTNLVRSSSDGITRSTRRRRQQQ